MLDVMRMFLDSLPPSAELRLAHAGYFEDRIDVAELERRVAAAVAREPYWDCYR